MATSKEKIRKLLLNMGRPLSTRELWNMQRQQNVVKSDMTNNVSNVGRRVSKTVTAARHPKSVNKAKKEYKRLERERQLEQWRTAGGNIGPSPTRTRQERQQRQNAADLQLWQQQKEQQNQEVAERIAGVTSLISPTQWLPTIFGKNNTLPGAENNYGLASALMSPAAAERFNREHPYINTAFNLAGDLAVPYAISKIPQGLSTLRNTFGVQQGGLRIGNTVYRPDRSTLNMGLKLEGVPARPTPVNLSAEQLNVVRTLYPKFPKDTEILGLLKKDGQIYPKITFLRDGNPVKGSNGQYLTTLTKDFGSIAEKDWPKAVQRLDNAIKKQKEIPIPNEINKLQKEYDLDFSKENWFQDRPGEFDPISNPAAPQKQDIIDYYGHIPEYYKITQDLFNKGQLQRTNQGWFGVVDDQMRRLAVPESYVVANSQNFKNAGLKYSITNDGRLYYSGMQTPQARIVAGINEAPPAPIWLNDNPRVNKAYMDDPIAYNSKFNNQYRFNIVEQERPVIVKPSNNPNASSYDYYGDGKHIVDATKGHENEVVEFPDYLDSYSDQRGTTKVIGKEVPSKVLFGNNGNFDMSIKNKFGSFVPYIPYGAGAGLGSSLIYNSYNKNSENI